MEKPSWCNFGIARTTFKLTGIVKRMSSSCSHILEERVNDQGVALCDTLCALETRISEDIL
ncbi:hypothetical protein SAY86_028934 [Trapa natans]|uniref:Uncharacterized protein n=1 Tax=Trapa natans TaxID=22666 RepID=A0AAN7RGW2_TRANT|nr:hypothetical protein SAY86_028934 [Trapa natans]